MKILYVVDGLATDGGIQVFAKNTRQAIGSSVELSSWSSPLTTWQKALVFLLPSNASARTYAKFLSHGMDQLLGRDQFDLVHFWNIKAAMAALGTIQVPYIVTCHGFEVMRPNLAKYQYPLFVRALDSAAAVTTPSQYTKDYLIQHYGVTSDKIHVIHPAVELPTLAVNTRGSSERTKTIGTLTRIGGRKNVLRVIDALEVLHSHGVNFNYCLAGTGPSSATGPIIERLKHAAFPWSYLGAISEEDKWADFYRSLDVFALTPVETSKDVEGFGIVYLEANASGVPVVASNTGGIPDAVKSNVSGLFADPNNPQDIADKIQTLLESNQDWTRKARRWAENFGRGKTAEQFKSLYLQAVDAPHLS